MSRDQQHSVKMAALDSPNFAEAREYVRQELAAMGGRALPEDELDTYTRGICLCPVQILLIMSVEFLRLVKEREVTPNTPDTTSSTLSRPHTTSSSSRSAVYKVNSSTLLVSWLLLQTFPAAGKENRIDLPASPAHYHSFTADDSDWSAYTTSDRKMKRKVFRRYKLITVAVFIT